MKEQKIISVQEWLPIEKILEKGIIKLKDNSYIKIIKIIPINYNLKSELEKEAILNSYKIFLKTCNFYIIIKNPNKNKKENIINNEIIIQDLNEKYFKIKECLSRCGNIAQEYDTKKEIINILDSFLNSRNYINNNLNNYI